MHLALCPALSACINQRASDHKREKLVLTYAKGSLLAVHGIKRIVEEPCLELTGIRKAFGLRFGVFYQDFSPLPFKILSHRAEDQATGESEGLSTAPVPTFWLGDSLTLFDPPTTPEQGVGESSTPPPAPMRNGVAITRKIKSTLRAKQSKPNRSPLKISEYFQNIFLNSWHFRHMQSPTF